jgi:hypothetical protein
MGRIVFAQFVAAISRLVVDEESKALIIQHLDRHFAEGRITFDEYVAACAELVVA